jgi:hypothetical protein
MTKTHGTGNDRFEELVASLRDELGSPDDEELRRLAHEASATERQALRPTRLRWPLRPAWTGVAVAASLLLASGLGFGLGSSLTPSGSAGTPFAGLGFLPANGWTVVQSDTSAPADAARAIAANVPLHPADSLASGPARTLETLPLHGVVIQVTFTTRGDPSQDFRFGDVVELPLNVANARAVPGRAGFEYRLRSGVGGYNLDARIHYGRATPSRAMRSAAQNQLNRLVVASERVTLLARPTVLGPSSPGLLYGTVDNGRAGEVVTIQAKDCGQRYFTGVQAATTSAGGTWNVPTFNRGVTTTVRAVWKGTASAPVTIRSIPEVGLDQRGAKVFEVGISSKGQFWRKQVLFQRRAGGKWVTLKQVTLTETGGQPGFPFVWTSAEFRASVPKGSQVRAVLPASQAKPCYLAAVSNVVRTS